MRGEVKDRERKRVMEGNERDRDGVVEGAKEVGEGGGVREGERG